MKKTRWASIDQLLKMSLFSSILFLCSLSNITSMAVTHAMGPKCSRHPQLCTPTPTLTPIATPSPKTMPTPQVQPHPTRVVLPVSTATAGTPPSATPTSTPASTMATVVPVAANQATRRTDATPANQQSQGTGDQSFNILMLSLGVGAPLFLLSGAMLWLLWRRQTDQHQPALERIPRNAQAARWMSSSGRQSPLDASQYASSAVLAPGVSEVWPLLGSTEPMPSPQLTDIPHDPGLMRTAFPQHMLTMPLNNAARSLQNGDSQSLLMDTLNLPLQLTEARESNKNGHMLPLAPPPTALMDTPTASMPSSLPATIQPPSIKDDPMLESMMRQAQMGLFALSGRSELSAP